MGFWGGFCLWMVFDQQRKLEIKYEVFFKKEAFAEQRPGTQ